MLLIFDLDGTLFETKVTAVHAVNRLCAELCTTPPDESRIKQNIGKPTPEFLKAVLPSGVDPEKVHDRFRELEQDEVRQNGRLFPGIQKLFSDGHSLCICSTGSTEYIELVLNGTGIRGFFNGIYSAKHASKAEIVKMLTQNGEPAVLIGDTSSDMEAAAKNHIPFIAAAYGYGDAEKLSCALFTAGSAPELSGLVEQTELFYHITQRLVFNGKRVIGISGVDTSGKTVFSENYSNFLGCLGIKNAVLHLDDFHNPSVVRYRGENEIDAYYYNAFNYPQLIDEVLSPFRKAGFLHKKVLCLNLDTDHYENIIRFDLDSDTVLLIEGVLLFRPPLDGFLDGRVFLDIPFDEVLRRAELRDVPKYGKAFLQKYVDKYIPIQKRYLSEHSPFKKSDFVIDNRDPEHPKFES